MPVDCWAGDAGVTAWMEAQHIAKGDYDSVERYFVNRVAALDSVLAANRTVMYWEEVFNNNASISPAAIIQAWKSDAMPGDDGDGDDDGDRWEGEKGIASPPVAVVVVVVAMLLLLLLLVVVVVVVLVAVPLWLCRR